MDYIVPSLGCLEKSAQSQLGSIQKNLNQGVNLDLLNIEDLNLDHQIPRGHPEIVFLPKTNFHIICSLPGHLIYMLGDIDKHVIESVNVVSPLIFPCRHHEPPGSDRKWLCPCSGLPHLPHCCWSHQEREDCL
ncbi:unnamed protein product, partial [Vitis vinifera]